VKIYFVMKDDDDVVVEGTPTVMTSAGDELTPEVDGDGWVVDSPEGVRVTMSLDGARTLDFSVPSLSDFFASLLDFDASEHATEGTVGDAVNRLLSMLPAADWVSLTHLTVDDNGAAFGRVINQFTGLPVKDCDVVAYLAVDTQRVSIINSTESDISGEYDLRVPPNAVYDVVFKHPSFGRIERRVTV
jgi:hypothetical protein